MSVSERLGEQVDRGVWPARLQDEFAQLDGDEGGLWLVSTGQEDAATEEPDGRDQLGQVRPRLRDGLFIATGVHGSHISKMACLYNKTACTVQGDSPLPIREITDGS